MSTNLSTATAAKLDLILTDTEALTRAGACTAPDLAEAFADVAQRFAHLTVEALTTEAATMRAAVYAMDTLGKVADRFGGDFATAARAHLTDIDADRAAALTVARDHGAWVTYGWTDTTYHVDRVLTLTAHVAADLARQVADLTAQLAAARAEAAAWEAHATEARRALDALDALDALVADLTA